MSNRGVPDAGCRRPRRRWSGVARPALALALGLVVLASLFAPLAAQTTGAPASEEERVLEAFERALNSGNVESALGHFSGDASVRHERSATGAAEVRRWIQRRVGENVHLHMDRYEVQGGRVVWTGEMGQGEWFNRRDEAQPRAVRGEAVVRNGQIVAYSLEYVDGSGGDPGAADGLAPVLVYLGPLVLSGGALAMLLLLAGVYVLKSGRYRPPDTPELVEGRGLVRALGAWAASRRPGGPAATPGG